MTDIDRLYHKIKDQWNHRRTLMNAGAEELRFLVELLDMMEVDGFAENINVSAKWVSVKDRLPEMEESVLVFCKAKTQHTHSIRTITEMSDVNPFNYKVKTKPYWRRPWDFFDANYEITHWMPLPEPPKEGENE